MYDMNCTSSQTKFSKGCRCSAGNKICIEIERIPFSFPAFSLKLLPCMVSKREYSHDMSFDIKHFRIIY